MKILTFYFGPIFLIFHDFLQISDGFFRAAHHQLKWPEPLESRVRRPGNHMLDVFERGPPRVT